jgi:hypothetical protein
MQNVRILTQFSIIANQFKFYCLIGKLGDLCPANIEFLLLDMH